MVSNLSASHLRSDIDLRMLMRLLGWQSAKFDGRMRCGSVPLGGLRPDEFIFFISYALAGLTPPFFFFFFFFLMLLENYGLQLHHLSPHPSR
jgi:hypothetical protein